MPKVFIVPSRGAHPDDHWYPWVAARLEERGCTVRVLEMPNPDVPKKSEWLGALQSAIPAVDEETYLIGHSVGCQAILRYLDLLPPGQRCAGITFVAGWIAVPNWEGRSEAQRAILDDWLNPPIELRRIAGRASRFTAVFSDDDEFVPRDNWAIAEQELAAHVVVKHGADHFEGQGALELPEVVDAVLGTAD